MTLRNAIEAVPMWVRFGTAMVAAAGLALQLSGTTIVSLDGLAIKDLQAQQIADSIDRTKLRFDVDAIKWEATEDRRQRRAEMRPLLVDLCQRRGGDWAEGAGLNCDSLGVRTRP